MKHSTTVGEEMRKMQPTLDRRLLLLSVMGLVAMVASAATAIGANSPTISVAFNPPTFDFGVVAANTVASHTYVLTNSGTKATGTIKVDLSDVNPDELGIFSMTADTCTGTKLSPKKSCSVTVQYAPTTAGTHSAAQVFARDLKPSTTFNAFVNIVGGVSEGCATVNGTTGGVTFNGLAQNAGVGPVPFKAGEKLTMAAGEPSLDSPTGLALIVNTLQVDTEPYPGTLHYTIPTDGDYSVGWEALPFGSGAAATWTVS